MAVGSLLFLNIAPCYKGLLLYYVMEESKNDYEMTPCFIAVRVANLFKKFGYILAVSNVNVTLCHSVSGPEILKECGVFIFRDLGLLDS
jgi:hypothetical protein